MPADLTLPGSIPGLLRRGSPVYSVWGEESIADGEYSDSGVVRSIAQADDGSGIAECSWDSGDPDPACATDTLHLDLGDPTGRAHAAWWLAARSGEVDPHARGEWLIDGTFSGGERAVDCWFAAHLIPDLDPDDPRLLPDGSRWVGAEALRRVVLHVAGLTSQETP